MESEGPYTYDLAFIGCKGGGWRIVGPSGPYGDVITPEGRAVERVKLLNAGYAEGRKAERERCLKIIERWRPMTKQTWVTVSDEIGGQDGE